MHSKKWMFCAFALIGAACSPTDRNFLTGTTDFTSVSVSLDPTQTTVAVGDSVALSTTVTLEPQGTVVVNGPELVEYSFSNDGVAEINGSGYIQGDSAGSTVLTATYTDKNHNNATTTATTTITVTP